MFLQSQAFLTEKKPDLNLAFFIEKKGVK